MIPTISKRRLAAAGIALVAALSLASCGAPQGSPSGTATSGTGAAAPPSSTADDAAVAAECAEIEQALATAGERLEQLQSKIPGDIPGAIADVQTSVDELQSTSAGLQDGELKTRVDAIIAHGNDLIGVLGKAQSGEITLLDAAAQASTLFTEVQTESAAISDYCHWPS